MRYLFTFLITTVFFFQTPETETGFQAERITFQGNSYDILIIDIDQQEVAFFWRDENKQKLKSIGALEGFLNRQGRELIFATNAGMYLKNNDPQGLYIENQEELRPLDLRTTKKLLNFYMKPNGVFALTKHEAFVLESEEFECIQDPVLYATQSGPMLVINGELHPKFNKESTSKYIRNGVGVMAPNKIVFAISNEVVNFHHFASLFKDKFQCENALYLDGAISRMHLPALGRKDTSGNFGAMIGIEK